MAPEKRAVGLVFQSYALWPHLTAVETVAYPLRRRGVPRDRALREAQQWLERVGMAELAQRLPNELSGGEQQRVGLARALASAPALFLFDEPTANLDASLKAALQGEISQQQRRTGAGAIYVTHDPAEAFAVAQRVAVLRQGRLVQVGSPVDVYSAPRDPWVAALTGPCSFIPVREAHETGPASLALEVFGQQLRCTGRIVSGGASAGTAILRPEWVALGGPKALSFDGRITLVRFQGSHTDYVVEMEGRAITAREVGQPVHAVGEAVSWRPTRVVVTSSRDGAEQLP